MRGDAAPRPWCGRQAATSCAKQRRASSMAGHRGGRRAGEHHRRRQQPTAAVWRAQLLRRDAARGAAVSGHDGRVAGAAARRRRRRRGAVPAHLAAARPSVAHPRGAHPRWQGCAACKRARHACRPAAHPFVLRHRGVAAAACVGRCRAHAPASAHGAAQITSNPAGQRACWGRATRWQHGRRRTAVALWSGRCTQRRAGAGSRVAQAVGRAQGT
mmetsp:Transcript_4679/g.14165  ORF Transcript_4679/g.14165 Transcript_4679/m.14165 type:complete len:215 (-) Transcript_4679:2697-3341(-)